MVMGVITTSLVSATLIYVNKGFVSGFVGIWLKSWLISYLVAVPTIIIIGPRVQGFLHRLADRN